MVLRRNGDYFCIWQQLIGFYNWDGVCLLRGTSWIYVMNKQRQTQPVYISQCTVLRNKVYRLNTLFDSGWSPHCNSNTAGREKQIECVQFRSIVVFKGLRAEGGDRNAICVCVGSVFLCPLFQPTYLTRWFITKTHSEQCTTHILIRT